MTLKDTASLMTSEDYKERFQAEYHQLKIRTGKLIQMLDMWDNGTLLFTPTCPRIILEDQLKHMISYLSVLSLRAQLENINLNGDDKL